MHPVRRLSDGLTDKSLRVAILVGLATVPVTLLLSWESVAGVDDGVVLGGSISGTPLLLAALFVGYYYSNREPDSRRAGIWTGLAGSLAAVLVYLANAAATIWAASPRMAAVAVVLTPLSVVFGVGLTVLVTMLAAQFSGWAARRLSRDHRVLEPETAADRASSDSRWWYRLVVAYALFAPIALGYTLGIAPESGAELGLSVLLLFVLVPLSVLAFVALFVDATAPRAAEAGWFPSVWLYVGVPIGAYALVYAGAAFSGEPRPAAPGVFGFTGALWAVVVVYLVQRNRDGGRA
ncbi:DUF5518 domain-containing protein [Natrononativus amylolyticus]|uniref:DUF5518 domain-containing protein n=1 Tax=Natrononativus amylolyticus TaxID=2963434 RepID=UPI0020CC510E|nr:DUF5518 domain-containing protein [Natrononativus amylolyticus]